MSGISVDVKVDMSRLERLIRNMPQRNLEATLDAAQAVVDDMRANWSGASPSAPGQSPAVVSGELDASVIALPEENMAGKATVKIAALAPHAGFLEFGTRNMAARPFMRPAIYRARGNIGRFYKILFMD